MTSNAEKLIVIDRAFDGDKALMKSGAVCANGETIDVAETSYGADADKLLATLKAGEAEVEKLNGELQKLAEAASEELKAKSADLRTQAQKVMGDAKATIEKAQAPFKAKLEAIAKKYDPEIAKLEAAAEAKAAVVQAIHAKAEAEITSKLAPMQAEFDKLREAAQKGEISREEFMEKTAPIRAQAQKIADPDRG